LSFHDETEATRRRKSPKSSHSGTDEKSGSVPPRRAARKGGGDIGRALRGAYHEVVEETIPPEMLDLLGKLG
jgi:hypothetical protein